MKGLLKSDRYKKSRGGFSRLLEIHCEKCGSFLCNYQKDGPGLLKRMYLDRISKSEKYENLQNILFKDIPQLSCIKCSQVIGIPMMYKKENRVAYRLILGSVKKKISTIV